MFEVQVISVSGGTSHVRTESLGCLQVEERGLR